MARFIAALFRFPLGGINGVLCLLSIERLSSQLGVERTCLERKAKLQQNKFCTPSYGKIDFAKAINFINITQMRKNAKARDFQKGNHNGLPLQLS